MSKVVCLYVLRLVNTFKISLFSDADESHFFLNLNVLSYCFCRHKFRSSI